MASAKAKIRHVFGDTFSCRAAPPDILVKLSGCNVFLNDLIFRWAILSLWRTLVWDRVKEGREFKFILVCIGI